MGVKRKKNIKFISIRKKLFVVEFLLVTVTILLLEALAFFFYYRTVDEKVDNILKQNSGQAINSIELILENSERLTEFPLLDKNLSGLLIYDYSNMKPEYLRYQRILNRKAVSEALYKGIFYGNNFVHSIELLVEKTHEIYCVGSYGMGDMNTYYKIKELPWYDEIVSAGGSASILGVNQDLYLSNDKTYVSVGRSISVYPLSGHRDAVIKINLRESAFYNILEHMALQKEGIVALADQNGNIVCQIWEGQEKPFTQDELNRHLYFDGEEKTEVLLGDKLYEKYASVSGRYGWSVISLFPRDVLYAEISQFGIGLLLLGGLLIFILGVITYFSSASITKPILSIAGNLKEIENGNWEVYAKTGNDEVGMLADTLNHMVERLRESIEEIYKKEDEKRNAELMALQAQINPHFLYNTLGAIRFMADVQGADNVVDALNDLIQLFQAVSHMEGELVPIREDLEIIRLYSEILMIRYMDCFSVEYDIDEELLECQTVKFLLQPLLENAIFHGFQNEMWEGLIRITIKEENGNVIFEVYDNGCGMDEEAIARVLDEHLPKKGGLNKIGVINVKNRIQMTFGYEYGLFIESEVGEYTRVKAIIPKIEMGEKC